MFKDRVSAGKLLAEKIESLQLKKPLIISIPRGGTAIAYPIAARLNAPLYVITPRKIGAPFQPELALGALAPDGTVTLDEFNLSTYGLTIKDLNVIIEKENKEIAERLKIYGKWGEIPDLNNRTVILVDDGIATGHTIQAAIKSLQKKGACPLILAVPVLPLDRLDFFAAMVDKLIFLIAPEDFYAVGQFYQDFSELTHEEVIKTLQQINDKIVF